MRRNLQKETTLGSSENYVISRKNSNSNIYESNAYREIADNKNFWLQWDERHNHCEGFGSLNQNFFIIIIDF